MNKWWRHAAVIVLVAAFVAGCSSGGGKVLATVNGENITERQLRTQAGIMGFLQQTTIDVADESMRTNVLQFLAHEHLLLQEAARRQLSPDPDFLAMTRSIIDQQYVGTGSTGSQAERDLANVLKPYGVTVSDLDTYLNRYATVIALEDSVVASAEVSEEDVRQFYDDNPAMFISPEQRRASHILLGTRDMGNGVKYTDEEAEAFIRELETELRQDLSRFAALAEEHSDDTGSAVNGGDLGFFGRGRMVPEFEEAAFNTPVGELSAPVKSDYGWHIVLVTDERLAEPRLFDDVKDDLREDLRQQRGYEAIESLLDNLKDSATYTPADLFQPPASP